MFYKLVVLLFCGFTLLYLSVAAINFGNKNNRFFNTDSEGKKILSDHKGLITFLKWRFFGTKESAEWQYKKNKTTPNVISKSNDLKITYITHASFLLQLNGVNIITDPVFSDKIGMSLGFLGTFGPTAFHKPALEISQLPKIDYILISHNHYDHLDIPSIKQIVKLYNSKIIFGKGNGRYVKNFTSNFTELNWNEKISTNDVDIHFLKAKHWSKRSLIDANLTLWGSFAVTSKNYKIYFSGDTGYSDHFTEIGKRFNNFDIALLGIGCYKPQWIMSSSHMSPQEAIEAALNLNAKLIIPMHYKTFKLSDESQNEPERDFIKA